MLGCQTLAVVGTISFSGAEIKDRTNQRDESKEHRPLEFVLTLTYGNEIDHGKGTNNGVYTEKCYDNNDVHKPQ